MKRLVAAMGRPVDGDGSALHASAADEGKALIEALDKLGEQMARVAASYPALTHDGEVDVERLKRAVGAAGATKRAEAEAEVKKGEAYIAKYMKKNVSFDKDANNGVNGFAPCYGSAKLKEALDFRADPEASVWKFDGEADVVTTPEYTEPAGGEAAAPAEEGDTPAEDGEEPAADETADDTDEPAADDSEEPAEEDTASDDSGLDLDVDVDISTDEETTDEEPAVEEETTDEEPAVEEETTDEEPVVEEETTDEEPAAEEETTDEEPVEEVEEEEESSDDISLDVDLDL